MVVGMPSVLVGAPRLPLPLFLGYKKLSAAAENPNRHPLLSLSRVPAGDRNPSSGGDPLAVARDHPEPLRESPELRIDELGILIDGIELEWAQSQGICCSLSPEFIEELHCALAPDPHP
jgi:hypothetical protein